jgi:hypothetical protein
VVCQATKKDGTPCSLPALAGSTTCWAHHPEHQSARRRGASKGGRNKPGTELHVLKQKLIQLGDDVMSKRADRGNAAVAVTCYATAIKCIEAEVKVRELQESKLVETELKVEEQRHIVDRMEQLYELLEAKQRQGIV